MKKCFAALVALLLLFAFAGCDRNAPEPQEGVDSDLSQSSAYMNYVDSVYAINAADSFSGNITLKTVMFIMGDPFEYKAVTGLKHIFGSGDNIEAELMGDESVEMVSTHYRDGIFYYKGAEDKFKFYYPGEDFLKMTNSRLVTEVLFSESDIFAFEAKEHPLYTEVFFDVYQSNMQDVLREATAYAMTGGVEEHDDEDLQYVFDDALVYIRFDRNGKMEEILLSIIAMFSHLDDVIETYIELGIVIDQVGGVQIDFPDDLDSYRDLY